ncbi:MAG: hypothetical protein LBR79_05180 [Oscillospiraceae bacterium]|nr:hypothetical protein [Oscillospiraceae bacterium]
MLEKTIKIFFLGSGHLAKDAPSPGKVAKNPVTKKTDKNIYYVCSPNKDSYKVSGPTALNGIFSDRSIGQQVRNSCAFFCDVITHELTQNIRLIIIIKGHSRGGIIAKKVYAFLFNRFSKKVTFVPPLYLDPYAGPISNILKENDQIEDSGVVVYTVNEQRFRTPASVTSASIVIFTNVAHDRCQFIKPPKGDTSGTYFLKGGGDEDAVLQHFKIMIRQLCEQLKAKLKIKSSSNPNYSEVDKLGKDIKTFKKSSREYVQKNLIKIENASQVKDCLDYLLIKTGTKRTKQRDDIVFNRLSQIAKSAVEEWRKEHEKKKFKLF